MFWSGWTFLAKRACVMAIANQHVPPSAANVEDVPTAAPRVGVIYNRHSHHNLRNEGAAARAVDGVLPDMPNVLVAEPEGSSDLPRILTQFKARGIELLVINGGDGTIRDVLTCGLAVWGDDWPVLAVLPRGKTNALNVDLGAPSHWTLAGVIAAFEHGQRIRRRGITMTPIAADRADHPQNGPGTMMGFILGAGAFTTGIKVGQDAHRLGAFNSLAVGVTTAWGVIQALLGSAGNRWRSGIGMEILTGPERRPLPHSGFGNPAQRWILVASTLNRLPVNMKLFGPYHDGLRMVVMDKARRRLLAMIPMVVAGKGPDWVTRAGVHFARASEFELALDDEFILDGEIFPAGRYHVAEGPELRFLVP